MRIRSLHPCYLDAKGIVALWREALLAKHVLEGKTKGYNHHPQLLRFKQQSDPLSAINQYLLCVRQEANKRGYQFVKEKIGSITHEISITVTDQQIVYEFDRLCKKLLIRDPLHREHTIHPLPADIIPHPLFKKIEGPIASWERI